MGFRLPLVPPAARWNINLQGNSQLNLGDQATLNSTRAKQLGVNGPSGDGALTAKPSHLLIFSIKAAAQRSRSDISGQFT